MDFFLKQNTKKNIFFIFIIPIIIQIILINLLQSVSDVRLYYVTFLLFGILFLPYFYWINSSVNFLYHHSNFFKSKLNNFKVSLIINFIMLLNFVFFAAYIFSFVFNGGEPSDIILLFVGLIQLIGIISLIYTNYFVAKLIATIKLKREVYFNDIVGDLTAFSFPPLAFWIIQKEVKKIQLDKN